MRDEFLVGLRAGDFHDFGPAHDFLPEQLAEMQKPDAMIAADSCWSSVVIQSDMTEAYVISLAG